MIYCIKNHEELNDEAKAYIDGVTMILPVRAAETIRAALEIASQRARPVDVKALKLENMNHICCDCRNVDKGNYIDHLNTLGLLNGLREGEIMVPVEPTQEMINAGNDWGEWGWAESSQHWNRSGNPDEIYKAMISARSERKPHEQ